MSGENPDGENRKTPCRQDPGRALNPEPTLLRGNSANSCAIMPYVLGLKPYWDEISFTGEAKVMYLVSREF